MPVNILKFEEVWLATHERAMSINKTIVFDDKYGKLIFNKENQTFSYNGKYSKLTGCKITGLVFRRQKFSILGYVKAASAIFILFSLKKNLLYGFFGLLIGLLLGLLVWYSSRWIVIEYTAPNEDKKI